MRLRPRRERADVGLRLAVALPRVDESPLLGEQRVVRAAVGGAARVSFFALVAGGAAQSALPVARIERLGADDFVRLDILDFGERGVVAHDLFCRLAVQVFDGDESFDRLDLVLHSVVQARGVGLNPLLGSARAEAHEHFGVGRA
ncbi:MAG: hypothetical protein DMF66_06470 [Acidobacteria bacterium]|nr:MAG: hypothetical protein DMF66_06470 [Acidobacteriota bacterium]